MGLRQPVENHLIGKIPVLIPAPLFCVEVGGKDGSPESIRTLIFLVRELRNRLGFSVVIFFLPSLGPEQVEGAAKVYVQVIGVSVVCQPTPPPPAVPPTKQQYLCQPLLDAVLANIRSPVFNHSLYRTFMPAVTAIHGPPIT